VTFLRNFYANYKKNEVGKEIAHIVLFVVSTVFSFNLFWQLSNVIFWQLVWGVLAIVFEYMKVQAFMYSKYYFKNLKIKNILSIIPLILVFSVYLLMAVISGTATWGFAKISIEQQSLTSVDRNLSKDISNSRITMIDKELEFLDDVIRATVEEKKKMNSYAGSYQTGQSMMTKDFLELSNRRNDLLKERSQIALKISDTKEVVDVDANDIFRLIGETPHVNLGAEAVKFLMFLAIVLLLEIVLCLTSGEISNKSDVDSMRQNNLIKYVNALFDTDANRLNSDKKIVEKTGVSLGDCKKYRKFLTSKEFGGTPLITYGRGYSKSDFTKSEIISIIKNV
jgi:hypothetical protein